MNKWINYHHLLYFKIIAEQESVSKAAKILRLGQSTLSAQLKQFEDNLGVKFFDREHKKLILTEQGKVALDYAQTIFKLGAEMYEVLHDKMVPSRPHLQIGALDSVPKKVLCHLSQYALKVGKCHLTLVEGKFDEMLRELTSHRVDLFISNFLPHGSEAKGLLHRSLAKSQLAIYGSIKYKPLAVNFPHSLKGQQFIMPTYDSKVRYDLEHWFKTRNINIDIIAETQDISLKKIMSSNGIGLMPAASHSVKSLVQNKTIYKIGTLDGIYEELFLISAQRKIANPIAHQIYKSYNLKPV